MFSPTKEQLEALSFFKDNTIPLLVKKNGDNFLKTKESIIENDNFIYYIFDFEQIDCEFNFSLEDENKEKFLKAFYEKGFSYETLIQDVISKRKKYSKLYLHVCKHSYYARFSKKYGQIEFYNEHSFIRKVKFFKKTMKVRDDEFFLIKKNTDKLFKINKNNKCLLNFRSKPKYISLKNIKSLIESTHIAWHLMLNKLLQIHLHSNLNFLELKEEIFISNKFSYEKNSIEDIIFTLNPKFKNRSILNYEFKNQIVQCALCLKVEQTEKFLNFYDSEFDLLIKNDFDLLMNVFFISGIISEIRSQKLCLFFYLFLLIENNLVIYEEGKIIFSNLKLQSIQKYVEYIYDMQRNEKNIEYEFKNNLDLKKINYKNNMLYRLKNYILFKSKKEDKQYIIKKIEKNKNGLNINLIKNNLELVNKSFLKGYGAEVVVNNIIWFELIDGKNTALIGLIKRENNIIVEKFLFDRKNNNSNEGEMLLNKIKSIFDINTYLSKGKKTEKRELVEKSVDDWEF